LNSGHGAQLAEVSKKRVKCLLSDMRLTLSWILSGLDGCPSSDDQIPNISSQLERMCVQLRQLAEQHFPPSANPGAHNDPATTLLRVGTSSRHQLTYCSPIMHELMAKVERIARRDLTVLITGETGVGKELIARFIHISSLRSKGPFVPINCAAIPRELFESQFFGHKQGSFTGAARDRTGIVRAAAAGTLFMDEIGELPIDLQPKLLRLLQEGEVHTVGDNGPTNIDVRIVASTNRDLEAEVRAGRFRADLLHRLKVISIEIPPLRERREDIPLLLDFFLENCSRVPGGYTVRLSPDSIDYLTRYGWPGNVRELSSLMLQIASLAEEDTVILPSDLPVEMTGLSPIAGAEPGSSEHLTAMAGPPPKEAVHLTLGEAVSLLERQSVYDALFNNNWSYTRAARQLGLSTYGLRKKYRRLFGGGVVASAAKE
jgi:transcriptional regulator with GAF, ATPase, and Fis domain